jgi:hypothetical protein
MYIVSMQQQKEVSEDKLMIDMMYTKKEFVDV